MPVTCRSCFYNNPDGSSFCLRCGKLLSPGSTQQLGSTQQPTQGFFPGATGGQAQQHQQVYAPPAAPAPQIPAVAPPASSVGSLRRAFAGHGTLIKHHSWLLDGQQAQVMSVRQAIFDKIVQRNLDGSRVSLENLIDQGLIDEHRDYIKVRRKSTTVFIYATPAGHDLYISRATTIQPGISLLRVVVPCLVLLAIIIPSVNVSASALEVGAGGQGGIGAALVPLFLWVALVLFFSLPLLWIFIVALFRSIVSLVFDKDFWVLLRPNRLTEFQRDEVALMEHTTDSIVREAMKQLGLDADKITAPLSGYQPVSRIRLI